jgi:hypothetical protein
MDRIAELKAYETRLAEIMEKDKLTSREKVEAIALCRKIQHLEDDIDFTEN